MPPTSGRKNRSTIVRAEPSVTERVGGVDVLAAEQLRHRWRHGVGVAAASSRSLSTGDPTGAPTVDRMPAGLAEGIADRVEPITDPDHGTRLERPEPERRDVDLAVQLGVGGEQDLKAAIEQEPVHLVGPDPSADIVGCLEDDDVSTGLAQDRRRGEPGQAGADDDGLGPPDRRSTRG